MRLFTLILCCITLARITGLDMAVAQLEAWGTMISERSEAGLTTAIQSTLSGETPCPKCLNLKKEKDKRNTETNDLQHASKKLKLPSTSISGDFFVLALPKMGYRFPSSHNIPLGIPLELDPPPPKSVLRQIS